MTTNETDAHPPTSAAAPGEPHANPVDAVVICGDLKNGRTIHSLVCALARFEANIVTLAANGRILDLKNFVSRMVIVPICRSTSPRLRRAISLMRSPAQ